MQITSQILLSFAAVLGASPALAAPTAEPTLSLDLPTLVPDLPTLAEVDGHSDDGRGTDFIFDRSDNICGNKAPMGITAPATVDYDALLAVTDEVRKIKKRKIDPHSAEGRTLMTAARRKVLDACEKVRRANNHCGVWKKIRRRDGRAIPDLTAKVKAKMSGK